MEKYNRFIRNIAELIEKGLFTSKDFKKKVQDTLKFEIDNIVSKLNLVSREEFEIQKKRIEKLESNTAQFKSQKKTKKKQKTRKAKKL
tara:strand:+ start:30 stop:293 length:264 start_codon:yes stop_codon:yes gene_type:complete